MHKWILYLATKLMFAGTMFMAAGAVADVTGGGDGASVDGGGHDPTPDGVDGEGSQAGEVGQRPAGEGGDSGDGNTPAKADSKVDGRTLPAKVRELLDGLKASDPKAHGFLKDVLFRDRELSRQFPGGLKEVAALKEEAESLKREFPNGLQGIKQERAEWDSIDNAYNAADPKFLDVMIEANPESFNKVMPMAIGKFAQVDPEGYQRHMAGIFHTTLANSGVLANLRFLNRAIELGDKEGAGAMLKEVTDWAEAIRQTSETKPQQQQVDPQLQQREQSLQQREDRIWVEQTAGEVNSFKTQSIRKELAQYAKGVQIDDETYEAIERQALEYLNKVLMADPQFSQTFNAYCEAKDRDGVVRYMKSKLGELLPSKGGKPGPVEKAYKLFFRGAAQPTRTPKTAPAGAAPASPSGWTKIGKAPDSNEIDMAKSPWEMRFKRAAILRSGKKVFWGESAPE